MSSESPTKKSQSIEEWEHRLDNVKVNKQDLNRLVMNYLVIEGYKDAAEQFSLESGVSPSLDLESIQERMEIRHAIQSGDIDTAIGLVNDVNPEILDTDPQLFFHLQQQRLIEMIRVGDYAGALEFATEEMAPRGIEHPEFLEELEKTMALFAFPDMHKSPVAELLHASQRQKTAGELNAAILLSQSREKNPRLPELLRLLTWSQEQLDDRMTYPRIEDFCSAKLVVRDGEGNIVDDAIDSTIS